MRNDIIKKIMIMFCCCLLCLNLTTRKVHATSPSLSSNLKYWVVCVVLALAGGVKVSADLTAEQVAEFKDKASNYFEDLKNEFGDNLKDMFTFDNFLAVVAGTATSLITRDNVKGGIAMKWVNTHLSQLKTLADKWIKDLDNDITFNPSSVKTVAKGDISNFFAGTKTRNIYYCPDESKDALIASLTNFYIKKYLKPSYLSDVEWKKKCNVDAIDKIDRDVKEGRLYFNPGYFIGYRSDSSEYGNIEVNTFIKVFNVYSLEDFKKANSYFLLTKLEGGHRYLSFYINNKPVNLKELGLYYGIVESIYLDLDSFNEVGVGVFSVYDNVYIPNVNYKLNDKIYSPTLEGKHKTLDNIKDYTDNLKNVDKLVYVKPDTLSIDKVGDNTIVSNPGVIGIPFPLPNDWSKPADKPYTGVDGKTHDPTKVLDPTKPWEDDKTKPVSIPADPANELPYSDVKDRADPKVLDPTIEIPKDDPIDVDVPDTKVTPSDSYRDWHKIFPFCIPFDIAEILTFLLAEPKAPKYEYDLGKAINTKSEVISIDLSKYDEQAKIIRNLELILFAVGLIMISRYIIKG